MRSALRPRSAFRRLAGVVAASGLIASPALLAAPAYAAEPATVVINEVESNGDTTDWVELINTGAAGVDISGYIVKDDDDTHTFVVPDGTLIAAGGLYVADVDAGASGFGLGGNDVARLFSPADQLTPIDSHAWTEHAPTSLGRCPDGTGTFAVTQSTTKAASNDCVTDPTGPVDPVDPVDPVAGTLVINEVESNGDDTDWVEVFNTGEAAVDISGYRFIDGDDTHLPYPLPAGSAVAPGGFFVIDQLTTTAPGFDFGLGGEDSVRLFTPDGATIAAQYSWAEHASVTYGRCPDGTGEFDATLESTRGAANLCEGVIETTPWPGGATVRTLDAEATFAGDLSGLDWEPSGSAAPGTLWAVQNGDGLLYRLVSGADGGWAPDASDGWSAGKVLHYTDGAGTVDAEGVTVAGDDSAGGVYVSSERDNAASSVSRPAVLRYDTSGAGSSLTATHEWNLAADFPGLGANAGLEGITWVPDDFLTDGGLLDDATSAAYDPDDYPDHGTGLFFIGVEGTAEVYAYALSGDGSFARVATIATPFSLVADVQFDADLGALWVVCDEACEGRIAAFPLTEGRFTVSTVFDRPTGMGNIANEGFALADDAVCTAEGTKPTFYADDADTDGFSLRQGTLPCEAPAQPGEPGEPGQPSPEPSQPATGGSAPDRGDRGTKALAATGGPDATVPALLGALLLIAGTAALVMRRRMRSR